MSILFINQKFEALAQKEQAINDYYDPVNRNGKQHINIQDLRDDYKEDLENYGFSKYQLKKDIEQTQLKQTDRGNSEFNTEALTNQMSSIQFTSTANQRPATAAPHSRPFIQIRPQTAAPYRSEDLIIHESDEQPFAQRVEKQQNKESKFWRNTKKFDTASQLQVRNQSALQKIQIEKQNNDGPANIQDEETFNKQLIEDRINFGKLGQLNNHQIYLKKQFYKERKQSPSDKDKFNSYVGFQDQLKLIRENSEVLVKTKKKILVPKQFMQFSTPIPIQQTQLKNILIQQIQEQLIHRTQEAPQYQSKLEQMYDEQLKRPSTATLKRPHSVQTIERMNRISNRTAPSNDNYMSQPNIAQAKQIKKIDIDYSSMQPIKVTPYHTIDLKSQDQSQTTGKAYPITSSFAMSLNYGDDNLASVMNLISSKSPSQGAQGVFKTAHQGLRPSSAMKKISLQKQQEVAQAYQVSSQSKLFGDQQNLRFIKKVRTMTNNILIKGTKYEPTE